MISTIFTSFSGLSDKFRHFLHPQGSQLHETNAVRTNRFGFSDTTKRVQFISNDVYEWLDRDGLNLLISHYDSLRSCFNKTCAVIRHHRSRAEMNKLLKPLLPVLADNIHDYNKLRLGEAGSDLCKLMLCLSEKMFQTLDTVYEIGSFIRLKDKHLAVPITIQHRLSSDQIETYTRIKNFMSAASLFTVLQDILVAGDVHGSIVPEEFIDCVILDMHAVENNLVFPSYVASERYHQKLLDHFPPPRRTDLDLCVPLPGTFPEPESEEDDAEYGDSHRRQATGDPYAADLVSREALNTADIGVIQSILRNRRTPKQLKMRRARKNVRFTENTRSPRQRTHLGFDFPKLLPSEGESGRHFFIDDAKPTDSGGRHGEPAAVPHSPGNNVNYESIFPRTKSSVPCQSHRKEVDPSRAIEEILSLPSIETLALSDDTRAGIVERKKKAAQKAAEEAKRLAEEQARQEQEERLKLRLPARPLVSPIGSDWLARAHATLRADAAKHLATTGEGVNLRRHDFETVIPSTAWLNDEIVNGSLNWLDQFVNSAAGIKDVKKTTRKCLSLSSFFFKRLQEQGVQGTQRTLRRFGVHNKNIFDVETILLPICEQLHWTLLVVQPGKKSISHMDSLNPHGSQRYIKVGLAWLRNVLEDQFVEDEWSVVRHNAPVQTNGYDCGVHTVTNGMCLALGINPADSYNTNDMPQQRLRLACMLLNGGFKGEFDLGVY